GSSMDSEEAIRVAAECGGLYGEVISRIDPSVSTPKYWENRSPLTSAAASSQVSNANLLEVLLARGRWIEAFELMYTALPKEASRVIPRVGHHLVDIGAFDYLWDGLVQLPDEVKNNADVAYWLVVAASATNRLSQVRELAQSILQYEEAPDLRAAVAVLHPSTQMVIEATRAIK